MKIKVITTVGTRPEIIRLSRVMYALDASPVIEHIIIHTGQNYDYELNEVFFEDLNIKNFENNFSFNINKYRDIWYSTSKDFDLKQTKNNKAIERFNNYKNQPLAIDW